MDYRSEIYMLPQHMRQPMLDYIEKGWKPGSFLTCILANDFAHAIGRADAVNLDFITEYGQYLVWHAPAVCWGSYEEVEAWIARGGLAGMKENVSGSQEAAVSAE